MYACAPDSQHHLKTLCIVIWKHGYFCMALCLCPTPLISVPIPCLECIHAPVHEFMFTWLPMSAPSLSIVWWKHGCLCVALCPCLLHPLCIVWWKPGCPCTAECLCPSHLISVPTPCLGCVHASVHVFISTWLPMLVQCPMNSYMETWVLVCGSVCVSQSPCLWSHTMIKMCTCISTCIHVHLPYNVCFTPFE